MTVTSGEPDPFLDVADLGQDPLVALATWLDLARAAGHPQAEAMALATSTCDQPAVRMVLLRGLDRGGLRFFTNRESHKGEQLRRNPRAAACLHWTVPRHRQVRAEGRIAELSAAESAAYFATRGAGSQISAWASPQSRPVSDRATLDRLWTAARTEHPDDASVPLPPFWGGYRLIPESVEFWQGRRDRLHDRIRFRRLGEGWTSERLAP